MAAAWITRLINATSSPITVSSNDSDWRPWVDGRQLQRDEPLTLPGQRVATPVIPLPPPLPLIVIPPGTTVVDVSYWLVGSVGLAHTTFAVPSGRTLKTAVGPKTNGNDWLLISDADTEIASIEIGPRGPRWIASIDFHVCFDESAREVRWTYWNTNGVGPEILEQMDEQFGRQASDIGHAIFEALFP